MNFAVENPFQGKRFIRLLEKDFHPDAKFMEELRPCIPMLEEIQEDFLNLFLNDIEKSQTFILDEYRQKVISTVDHQEDVYNFDFGKRVLTLLQSDLNKSHELHQVINEGELQSNGFAPKTFTQIQMYQLANQRSHVLSPLRDQLWANNFGIIHQIAIEELERLSRRYIIYTDCLCKNILMIYDYDKDY